MLGMGTAVLTLVGRRVGEGQPELASRTVWNAMNISGIYMIGFAAIYLTIPGVILAPFMHSQDVESFSEIRPIVIDLLKFVAIYTLFDAMAIVFWIGDSRRRRTRFSMIFHGFDQLDHDGAADTLGGPDRSGSLLLLGRGHVVHHHAGNRISVSVSTRKVEDDARHRTSRGIRTAITKTKSLIQK